jgi:hypothetical protein
LYKQAFVELKRDFCITPTSLKIGESISKTNISKPGLDYITVFQQSHIAT